MFISVHLEKMELGHKTLIDHFFQSVCLPMMAKEALDKAKRFKTKMSVLGK